MIRGIHLEPRGDHSTDPFKHTQDGGVPLGGLRYIGRGAHLDVPRRDLMPDEVEQFGREWLLSLHCPNTDGPMYAEYEQSEPSEPNEKVE